MNSSKVRRKVEAAENIDTDEKKKIIRSSPKLPFLLEITPERLEIPAEGILEVTIKNPTKDTQNVYCQFDSFYFLVDFKSSDSWGQQGDTLSAAYGHYELTPGESCILTIGYENGRYPEFKWEKGICCRLEEDAREDMKVLKARMESRGNIYYNCDRPEGYLKIMHRKKSEDSKWAVREVELYLVEETEKYGELKEKYLKIRKDQDRRARWGETLITDDNGTRRIFKVEPDIKRYVTGRDNEYDCSMQFWEHVLADKCIPKENLEEFDEMSDEEIQNLKMEKRKLYLVTDSDGDDRLKTEELLMEIENAWGKRCHCGMPEHYLKKIDEGSGKPKPKKKKKKKKNQKNQKKPIFRLSPVCRTPIPKSDRSEKPESPAKTSQKTKTSETSEESTIPKSSRKSKTSETSEESKISKKSAETEPPSTKSAQKPVDSPARPPATTTTSEETRKAPEAPQPIPISRKMSVTRETDKKIVEKKNNMEMKKKKKKKKNPCCSIC